MDEPLHWNDWKRVYPVLIEGEPEPKARAVRLATASMRVGDPVEISLGDWIVVGTITAIVSAVIHVRPQPILTA